MHFNVTSKKLYIHFIIHSSITTTESRSKIIHNSIYDIKPLISQSEAMHKSIK